MLRAGELKWAMERGPRGAGKPGGPRDEVVIAPGFPLPLRVHIARAVHMIHDDTNTQCSVAVVAPGRAKYPALPAAVAEGEIIVSTEFGHCNILVISLATGRAREWERRGRRQQKRDTRGSEVPGTQEMGRVGQGGVGFAALHGHTEAHCPWAQGIVSAERQQDRPAAPSPAPPTHPSKGCGELCPSAPGPAQLLSTERGSRGAEHL